MAEKQEINTPAEEYFRKLSVTFDAYVGVKQPDLTNSENFYTIYSPKKFTLKPREDIVLDLKFNIATSKELDPWISLLPTLKTNGLAIVDKRETPKKTIELHLQNQSYYYTVKVRKEQCIAFIFLLGELNTDITKTEYNYLKYIIVVFFPTPLTTCTDTVFISSARKLTSSALHTVSPFLAIGRKSFFFHQLQTI